MELLISLADIFLSDRYGFEFSQDEVAYRKAMETSGKHPIGFQSHQGYISFNAIYMCGLIAQWMEEDTVPASRLARELNRHHLGYSDGSRSLSCRWDTEGSYVHVNMRRLIELVTGTEVEEYDLIQEYIENFEKSFV